MDMSHLSRDVDGVEMQDSAIGLKWDACLKTCMAVSHIWPAGMMAWGIKDKSDVDLHYVVLSMNEAPSLPHNHTSLTHSLTDMLATCMKISRESESEI